MECNDCFFKGKDEHYLGKYREIRIVTQFCNIRHKGIRLTYKKVYETKSGKVYEEHDYYAETFGNEHCTEKSVIFPKVSSLWK